MMNLTFVFKCHQTLQVFSKSEICRIPYLHS